MRVSPNRLYGVLKFEEPREVDKEVGSRVHFLILDNEGNIRDRLFFTPVDRLQPDLFDEGMPAEGIGKRRDEFALCVVTRECLSVMGP